MPTPDDPADQNDGPEVLNDHPCVARAEMRPNDPHSILQEELMELTTAAEPQSPVKDPLDFRDVRSGVSEAEDNAQCAPSGVEQAQAPATNEQGTVATCPWPENAATAMQHTPAISPCPVEATQPQPGAAADATSPKAPPEVNAIMKGAGYVPYDRMEDEVEIRTTLPWAGRVRLSVPAHMLRRLQQHLQVLKETIGPFLPDDVEW